MTGENKINAETIRVFIDDHNDAAPKFSNDLPINISITELSLIGDSFKLSNAIAHDSDAYYNQITYYLKSGTWTCETVKQTRQENPRRSSEKKQHSILW